MWSLIDRQTKKLQTLTNNRLTALFNTIQGSYIERTKTSDS